MFRRIDLARLASVVEWMGDQDTELEVLAYEQHGPAYYVAVALHPKGGITESYLLACDSEGRVLRTLSADDYFGKWQFLQLGGGREALVVDGGGGFHVWDHVWIYPLAFDGIPEQPILDVRGELVEVRQEKDRISVVRHFARFGGGSRACYEL